MLQELENPRQIPEEPKRRWFTNDFFDLIVWSDKSGKIIGFQLCYQKGTEEKAITWLSNAGFSHKSVDDGESRPGRTKMTPILLPNGEFNKKMVVNFSLERSREIDTEVVNFVYDKLSEYPG